MVVLRFPSLVSCLRGALFALVASTTLGAAGCEVRTSTARAPGGRAGMWADARASEAHRPGQQRRTASAPLFLPGGRDQQVVTFDVVDGMAVMEGDIVLGRTTDLPMRYGIPWPQNTNVHGAVAMANRSALWPGGQIPYAIDPSVSPQKADYVQWAIAHLATTELKVRPKTAQETDYVLFRETPSDGGCHSYLGRIGGAQELQLAGCGRGSVVHELLHAAGFYHEQSRGDRDDWITINWNEIVPEYQSAFQKRDGRGQDIGPYDYGSIMHYSGAAFSRTGNPTIVPKQPGAVIGQREGLSQHDRAAITFLYGAGATGPTLPPTQPLPPPATTQPPATTAPPPAAPPPSSGLFAGRYSSQRGPVTCTQNGPSVSCTYPGGSMVCAANGASLDCGWMGGGQGRALFQRQASGVLAGSWGDLFSNNSRGAWDLVPEGAPPSGPVSPPSGPPSQPPPTAPGAPPPATPVSLSGNYSSTRGPMSCTENATSLSCSFQESTSTGRLDCVKDASGLQLSCTWATAFPTPGSGRAVLTRKSAGERALSGTWGHFLATTGGGAWEMTGQ